MNQKRILLIQPPHGSSNNDYATRAYFPIGLGFISRALIDNGCKVKVLDIRINKYNRYEVKEIINKSNYEIFGISALEIQYEYVKFLSKIKNPIYNLIKIKDRRKKLNKLYNKINNIV